MNKFNKTIVAKKEKTITTEVLNEVRAVFINNNWKIDSEGNEVISWRNRFNKFCEMLGKLNVEEQNFILELTKNYTYINADSYLSMINNLLVRMYSCNYNSIKTYNKLYVMPLISPEDREQQKDKSSIHMQYLFGATEMAYIDCLEDVEIIKTGKINMLPKNINNKSTSLVIIVDDFIGTGDTALECLKEYEKAEINKNKLLIISLVAMEEGKLKLIENGYNIFVLEERNKGITDKYVGVTLEEKTALMKQIEDKFKIKECDRFGYKKSEALVTMIRTPNNTFPIFWSDKKKSPFPRR